MTNRALKKYKGFQFESVGHSQGGLLSHLTNSDKIKNTYELNPAYKDEALKNNEFIIRSSGDVVSALLVPKKMMNQMLFQTWTKEHMITIEKQTNDPLTEHKVDILSRLDPNIKIGKGGNIRKLKGYIIL